MLAGPILRRVEPTRVTVWLALRTEAPVTLQIWNQREPGGAQLGSASAKTIRVGAGLCIVLATVELANALVPEAIYGYDLVIDGQTLGQLGLLRDNEINGHRHVPLGYEVDHRPSFALPPRDVTQLITAHTSCRLLYSPGHDAMVSLDRLIADGRNDWRRRPHQLFLTGDQVYADNVAPEMLRWLMSVGGELISGAWTGGIWDRTTIEHLRVNLNVDERNQPEDVARFPADELHFPPGRRTYLATLAAKLTSQDGTSHLMSLGEYSALYLFGWSNVLWPQLAGPGVTEWTAQHVIRGRRVLEFVSVFEAKLDERDAAVRAHGGDYVLPDNADTRLQHEAGWLLVSPRLRAIDRFLQTWSASSPTMDVVDIWDSKHPFTDTTVIDPWHRLWTASAGATDRVARRVPPRSDVPPQPVDDADKVPTTAFAGENPQTLRRLARLLTPSWYAGPTHFALGFDTPDVPAANTQRPRVVLEKDEVLERLRAMRVIYEGLPYVRRALANVPTYMMFDDHEVSDDWNITRDWVEGVRSEALGRDVLRNALTAYTLFQDLGNDPIRYTTTDTPQTKALAAIGELFFESGTLVDDGPRQPAVDELEKRFGITKLGAGGLATEPVDDTTRVHWHYRVDGPGYEVLVLDNRTGRGYEARTSVPANLSAYRSRDRFPVIRRPEMWHRTSRSSSRRCPCSAFRRSNRSVSRSSISSSRSGATRAHARSNRTRRCSARITSVACCAIPNTGA